MKFFGRKSELRLLDSLAGSTEARLLILYGRRRVGKTRLLTHWLAKRKRNCLYFVAEPTSSTEQLRSFSRALYDFANPGMQAPDTFSYADWSQVWEQISRLAEQRRFILLLDEFTYLLGVNPAIAASLQNAWDHLLKQKNLFLVISGSHLGMMQRQVLAYQAPLYGRANAQLHLQPLPFAVSRDFFPRYSQSERVAIYAMFGGIPAYWERLDQTVSISQNIKNQLLTSNNLMQDEPRLLLQDFLTESHNYIAILRAIAGGDRVQKEIVYRTGLPQGHVSKYLNVLMEAGFIERRVPVTDSPKSRKGRYYLTDPYLRFYYRFLAPRQAQLALGIPDQALAEIKRHLIDFIGTHTWEELCREWVLRASAKGVIPLPDTVGAIWGPSAQIDVAGINSMEKTLLLGECKWGKTKAGVDTLSGLTDKTANALPASGNWSVTYIGFARSGWTEKAIRYARSYQNSGERWKSRRMLLLTLNQVERDLYKWSG